MHAEQDTQVDGTQVEVTRLPDLAVDPGREADTVLGTDAAPSPLDVVEGTTPLLEMDRLDIGTPVADLGTQQISPR